MICLSDASLQGHLCVHISMYRIHPAALQWLLGWVFIRLKILQKNSSYRRQYTLSGQTQLTLMCFVLMTEILTWLVYFRSHDDSRENPAIVSGEFFSVCFCRLLQYRVCTLSLSL